MIGTILSILAVAMGLQGNADVKEDRDRLAVQVRAVSLYDNKSTGWVTTKAFKSVLVAGNVVNVCAVSRAVKPDQDGGLLFIVPRAEQQFTNRYYYGQNYRSRCATVVISQDASMFPGIVQVSNVGKDGRLDRIRRVWVEVIHDAG